MSFFSMKSLVSFEHSSVCPNESKQNVILFCEESNETNIDIQLTSQEKYHYGMNLLNVFKDNTVDTLNNLILKISKHVFRQVASQYNKDRDPLWWGVPHSNHKLNVEVLDLLIEHVDIEQRNYYGQTFLLFLVERQHKYAVMYLTAKLVNLNVQDYSGMGALHYAVYNYDLDIISYLLDCGIHVDLKDTQGCTPLMYMVFNTHHQHIYSKSRSSSQIIQLLLKHHADPLLCSVKGYNSLALARLCQNPQLISLLSSNVQSQEEYICNQTQNLSIG